MATIQPAGGKEAGETHRFKIEMDRIEDYRFLVRFDKGHYADLQLDEPAPLGSDSAPNASRILAAAVGNCLSASLLFCARKARVNVRGLRTEVKVAYARNENGRLRIGRIEVEIAPQLDEAERDKAQRCLDVFEDYCVVTQSVRGGIDVSVSVKQQ